jgi:hypothetical protein
MKYYPTRRRQVFPISAKMSWHSKFQFFFRNSTMTAYLNMDLRRSRRKPVPKTIWEEKGAPSAAKDPKITGKNARTEKKTALEPIVTGPLPKNVELKKGKLPKLPTYNPPLDFAKRAL